MDNITNSIAYDPAEPVFTIGLAAKKIGVSPETLRLYEREGLLIPHKTETGRRLFSHADLEWIACIRRQITVHKLNITGIRRLLALIPCWEFKPCMKEERKKCPAYESNYNICWQLAKTSATCAEDECRICNVYRMAGKVGHLKEIFKFSLKKEAH